MWMAHPGHGHHHFQHLWCGDPAAQLLEAPADQVTYRMSAQQPSCRRRPYHVECTGSLLTSEVKRHRARLVLGWGTAWEDLRVLSAFAPASPEFFDHCVFCVCSVCWGKGVAGWVAGAKCSSGSFLVFALMHVDGSPRSSCCLLYTSPSPRDPE